MRLQSLGPIGLALGALFAGCSGHLIQKRNSTTPTPTGLPSDANPTVPVAPYYTGPTQNGTFLNGTLPDGLFLNGTNYHSTRPQCSNGGCGGSGNGTCLLNQTLQARGEHAPAQHGIGKRAFVPMNAAWAAQELAAQNWVWDMSKWENSEMPWHNFGAGRSGAAVVGLEGCTVVAGKLHPFPPVLPAGRCDGPVADVELQLSRPRV